MAIESKATVVSLLRDWVKLFMCNQADVKMVMGKTSQPFFFFLKKETQGRKCTTVVEALSRSKSAVSTAAYACCYSGFTIHFQIRSESKSRKVFKVSENDLIMLNKNAMSLSRNTEDLKEWILVLKWLYPQNLSINLKC